MTMLDGLIKVIGSKYFVLALGIGICFAIPPCWHAVAIQPTAIDIGIFLMACITAGLSFYKFANMFLAQRRQPAQESKEW